jgi:hypothetical protein
MVLRESQEAGDCLMARAVQEFDLQKAFYQWLIGWPDKTGTPTKQPALLPGVECWHTPNGGERRSAFEGMRLKEIGVTAGVPDLLFLRPTQFAEGVFGLLYGMEWKKPNGKPAETQLNSAQKLMRPRLLAAGMAAWVTVDNLADARAWSFAQMLTFRF